MNWSLFVSFLAASVVILMAPGPSLAYTIALASRASRGEVLLNAAGMGLGGLVIVLALSLGFAQLLQTAPLAYSVLQVAGCVYLVALGVQAWRTAPAAEPAADPASARARPPWASRMAGPLLQGFLVETTNPKSILFFSALIPQFADAQLGHVQAQLLFLGCTFLCLQVTWDASLMLLVHRFRHRLGKAWTPTRQRWANRLGGATFVGLGLGLLLHERPQP
jgi:threonine/homoserine/homoserine lactone efflux protein